MNYEEREKQLCNNCEAKENCSYISRNLERKCSFQETTMYGWELGYRDAIEKAYEWINENIYKYTWVNHTQMEFGINRADLLSDLKQAMEENK